MPSSCLVVKSTNLLAGLCCTLAQKPKHQASEDTFKSIFISFSTLKTSWCVRSWQSQHSRLRNNLRRKVVIWKFPTIKLGFERQGDPFPGGVPVGTIVLSLQPRDRFSGPKKKGTTSALRRSQSGCHHEGLGCLLLSCLLWWRIQAGLCTREAWMLPPQPLML